MEGCCQIISHHVRRRTFWITCFSTVSIVATIFMGSFFISYNNLLIPHQYRNQLLISRNEKSFHEASRNSTLAISKENSEYESDNLFQAPKGEKPEKRFPQAVIIGFPKCGTRAVFVFLSKHPYIVAGNGEVHFYNRDANFSKGYEWYRQRMKASYSNQITLEKTPAYVFTPRARGEMSKRFPEIKLIVLVRNPVERLLSQHAQFVARLGDITKYPLNSSYLKPDSKELDNTTIEVKQGMYYEHLCPWFQTFNQSQILVLFAEDLDSNPYKVMKEIEDFLDLPANFKPAHFQYNTTSGFYCYHEIDNDGKDREENGLQCLGRAKGRPHYPLPEKDEKMLYDFYKPHNEQLFKLVGKRYKWSA